MVSQDRATALQPRQHSKTPISKKRKEVLVHRSAGCTRSMAPTSASGEGFRELPLVVEGEGEMHHMTGKEEGWEAEAGGSRG